MSAGEREITINKVVISAHLTQASSQISRYLSSGTMLDPRQEGVQLEEVLPTHGELDTLGFHLFGLGSQSEDGVLETNGWRRNPETGEMEEVRQFEGRENEAQQGLGGMRLRDDLTVTAPTTDDDDYIIRQEIEGNRGQATRRALADATGSARGPH